MKKLFGRGTSGATAAMDPNISWASFVDKEKESRTNVLLLHDARHGTALRNNQPVLCASCHYSAALDVFGQGPSSQQGLYASMSRVMHSFHADKMRKPSGGLFSDQVVLRGQSVTAPADQACYQCHPGIETKCLRGAMTDSVVCQNCHGNMAAVGGDFNLMFGGSIDASNDGAPRRPWRDLPRCQSCHTGDAMQHQTTPGLFTMSSDEIRSLVAFISGDPSASSRLATNNRFAENTNKLFRHSKGHAGLACESCHGSTHAIWPNQNLNANDNIISSELQGHAGTIGECSACHRGASLALTMNGPHGMHNVNDSRWIGRHSSFYESNPQSCKSCHGQDLRGTVLSKTYADRIFSGEEIGVKHFSKGTIIGCYSCHNGPNSD